MLQVAHIHGVLQRCLAVHIWCTAVVHVGVLLQFMFNVWAKTRAAITG